MQAVFPLYWEATIMKMKHLRVLRAGLVLLIALLLAACAGRQDTPTLTEALADLEGLAAGDGLAYQWTEDSELPYTVYAVGEDYYALRESDGQPLLEQLAYKGVSYTRFSMDGQTEWHETGEDTAGLPGFSALAAIGGAPLFADAAAERQGDQVIFSAPQAYLDDLRASRAEASRTLSASMPNPASFAPYAEQTEQSVFSDGRLVFTYSQDQLTSVSWSMTIEQPVLAVDSQGTLAVSEETEIVQETKSGVLLDTTPAEAAAALQTQADEAAGG